MSDFKAVVVAARTNLNSTATGKRRFVEHYPTFAGIQSGQALRFLDGMHVAVLEMPADHPAYAQEALHVLNKMRGYSETLPIVCVAPAKPAEDVAARIQANKAILVTGNYNVRKLLGRQGIAAALRETHFQWHARNITVPSTVSPDVEMTVRLVGNQPKDGTLKAENGPVHVTPWHVGFLSRLAGGDFYGRQYLLNDMYKDAPEPAAMKIIDVQICRLNKLLRNSNLTPIEKIWGIGRRWPVNLKIDYIEPEVPAAVSDNAPAPAPAPA